ncbi:MAG: glutamate synthase large subunit, partial [Pseudomonadales bacterium]|nr:glutamate synthase large subunit [Pseudomonadales bacterium]
MSKGLYRPEEFRDNCGFGLIAHLKGDASHRLLSTAIESLTCMTHRGGIAPDGKTGDGCGLLFSKPDTFLRAVAQDDIGITLPANYAVAMLFLNRESAVKDEQQAQVEAVLAAQGLKALGWRQVPVDSSVLGEIALGNMPDIYQLFIGFADTAETKDNAHEAELFIARRLLEKALQGSPDFYICSFSTQVISYKGLMMPVDLAGFYPDLADERLAASICVFHQRFSTNTLPQWPLAQPFRMLAHNGEINTILGNRNWSDARRTKFVSPA